VGEGREVSGTGLGKRRGWFGGGDAGCGEGEEESEERSAAAAALLPDPTLLPTDRPSSTSACLARRGVRRSRPAPPTRRGGGCEAEVRRVDDGTHGLTGLEEKGGMASCADLCDERRAEGGERAEGDEAAQLDGDGSALSLDTR